MSTLVTKKGIANLAANLCQRHVLAELLDQIIKGKSEPITVTKLAGAISVTSADVVQALGALESRGLIRITSGHTFDEIGSFYIDGIAIDIEADQLAMATQTRSEPSTPSRDVSGMDQFELAGNIRTETIRATVLPQRNMDETLNGWFTLNIVRNPGLDGEFLILDKEFPDMVEAWGYWDEWAAGYKRDAAGDDLFLDWIAELPSLPKETAMDGDYEVSVVDIGTDEFERLVKLVNDEDERQCELVLEAGQIIYCDRCYRRTTHGETFPTSEDHAEPLPEFDQAFDIEIMTAGGARKIAVNWIPDVHNAGVAMTAFEFVPQWDTDQVWRREVLAARIPGEQEEFVALACKLAQDHYDKHGGGQS